MTENERFNPGDFPAFPMYNELGNVHAEGLTKREYFAAMAMQGILTGCWQSRGTHNIPDDNLIAQYSTEMADALLNQLNKNNGQ